jgi:outer membrane protein assembly factor BamB
MVRTVTPFANTSVDRLARALLATEYLMTGFRTVVLLLLSASVAGAADWPQWLGPRRDGSTTENVAPWKEAPKVLWRIPVPKGYSCPVVAQGRVFVHTAVPEKEAEEVIALDAVSGKILWRDVYNRASYQSVLGRGPRATPCAVGQRLYTCGITGVLSCYEADSGKRVWQVDTIQKLGRGVPAFGMCCSPLVVGNVVLLNVGGKGCSLVAFDTGTGDILWKQYDEPSSTSSPVLFAAPPQPGKLPDVVFMTTLRLLAVNPLDGALSWEYPLVFQPAGAATTPLVSGNRLITSTITNGSTALEVNVQDNKLVPTKLWQDKDMTGYFSTGVIVGKDQLYLVTNALQPKPSCTLRCVNSHTGKELWHKEGIGYYHAGLIRSGAGDLLILDDSGRLRLVQANPKEYREVCSAKVCGGTFSVPALANGRLYVRDDKEVLCLELPR